MEYAAENGPFIPTLVGRPILMPYLHEVIVNVRADVN